MPAAIPVAAVAAGAIVSAIGQHSAQKSQERSSNQALAFAREQEAERKSEYDKQQAAAAYQWKVMQANLAPYRAARAAVLSKYGVNTSVEEPPMPAGFGMPGGPAPSLVPKRDTGPGGGFNPLLLAGGGLAAGAGAYGQYMMQNRQPNPYTNMPGTYTNSQPGTQGGPPGPPAPPPVNTGDLYNWDQYLNAQPYYQGGE